jgi:predicted CXXCH cytochrome family protein
VSCHDPHAGPAGAKGLLKPAPHRPFAQGKCDDCHGTKRTGATVAAVPELCFKCHEPKREWLSAPVVHAPLKTKEACLACHGPHSGEPTAILVKAGEALCFTCHDPKPFRRKNVHAALADGCETCHDPHGSKNQKLLLHDVDTLCRGCHEDMTKHYHPVTGKTDPRTGGPLACTGCHLPHSSDQEALLTYEPRRELCIQCHDPSMIPEGRDR